MKKYFFLYRLATSAAGLAGWPWFYWHLRTRGRGESFLPRLGLKLPAAGPPLGRPRLWVHGVSVGEILAAVPLAQELKAMLPELGLIISTGTETGQAVARGHFQPLEALVCYFPLDLPWAVARYLDYLKPHLYISLESEIWPNFLVAAHRRGVRLALLNARLSDRSFARFQRYNKYLFDIINLFEVIAAGSPQDYERLRSLGLPPDKLHLTGNLKVDSLWRRMSEIGLKDLSEGKQGLPSGSLPSSIQAALGALPGQPVFLAASTHSGEENTVLEAYERLLGPYPTLLLVLAPRHPERVQEIGRLLQERGLRYQCWQRLKSGEENRTQAVVLVDTIGDLLGLYGAATVAFVGGSLVPHGGQNILEAAAWGLAPIYGPYLTNFRWAQELLEGVEGGFLVEGVDSLTSTARSLLDHPELRLAAGRRGREALAGHLGAARRQAQLVANLLEKTR